MELSYFSGKKVVSLLKDEIIEQLLQQVNSLTDVITAQVSLIAQFNQTI